MRGRDHIVIRNLRVRGILGVEEWERHEPQEIVLNITAFTDLAPAGKSEDLADAINYRTLADAVVAYVEGSRHLLVEALAAAVARLAVVEFGVERVVVRVEKPAALPRAESVGVEIERERADFP